MKHKPFKRVALMGRRRVSNIPETVQKLRDFLISQGVSVVMETHTGQTIQEKTLPLVESNALKDHCDLIILVGGDGSMINAAYVAITQNLPVLGVNRGRTGFLTDIHPEELSKITRVLQGEYQLEERILLEAQLPGRQRIALNELALLPGDAARMIDFDLQINGKFVCHQRADGLIIATPTGSTAYALSAGGPIIEPDVDALVLVPMFPYTLSSRPLVVPTQSKIELIINKRNESAPYLSSDGQEKISLPPGTSIQIQAYAKRLQLIHPNDYDYFSTLREKLGWNSR